LTATVVDPARGLVRVAWNTGSAPVANAEVLRQSGACPPTPDARKAELVARLNASPRRAQTADDYGFSPGTYCFLVVMTGKLGRPGPTAAVTLTYLGQAPTARLGYSQYGDGEGVSFFDGSYDAEGRIVAWRWDFGDGTGAVESDPTHVYAAPGTYQVTLTVTDDSGQTGTVTQAVEVS
jgi:hypothetical protein